MEVLEVIIKVGGAITALIVIGKTILSLVHLADDIKEIKEHTYENYLTCLRLTVMSHDMPIGERIIAGDKYISAGGNGDVKHYIETELHTKEVQRNVSKE